MDQSDSENVQSKKRKWNRPRHRDRNNLVQALGTKLLPLNRITRTPPNPITESTSPSQTPKRTDTRSRSPSVLPFSALDELNRIRRENRRLENQKATLEDFESRLREKEIANQQQLERDKEKLAQKEAELDIREKGLELLLPKHTLEDNLRQDINEMEERKRGKEENELPDIPTGSNEALRSSRHKQKQDEPRDVISIGENASKISHRATSLYDNWSETGSTFLEKDKYKDYLAILDIKHYHKHKLHTSGDFMQVKGLADTGANLNVAGLSSMQAYKIREEKPQFIKNVTFMDKKHIPVKAVVIAHVVLVQDGWKLDLKEQRFFCVDSELWDEMIIGDRTLRYFGVKLNIKDAPKAVHIWGIKQLNAQMSLLSPIEVSLKQGYSILRSDGYHLTVDEENFLDLKFKALEAAGIVERSTNPTWGHPVFVVEKKLANPSNWAELFNEERVEWKWENILNRYRMVANMIRLSKITVPTSLNLPNLERQFLSITNNSFYLTLNILSGFDFLPTAEKDRDIFTLVTRRSAWRMKGAPIGWSNTLTLFFERVITEIINADGVEDLFGAQSNGVIAWLDDLLVYSQSFEQLLIIFEKLLKQAARKRVRFNLRKCGICSPTTV
eukprot:augustus_masked-scaffold_60-processed-gene-0.69-mRNA-1 protein AED:1.00 eAED:1.00 QI:0/0/0/0/1/1/4/0/614